MEANITPRKSYIICATRRVGSHLLCDLLSQTGIAGNPASYYWDSDFGQPSPYPTFLRKGTTPNGVFGIKVMWGYYADLVNKLRHLPGCAALEVPELMQKVLPDLRYIFLTRHDKVRQAISYWKALQTNVWVLEGKDAHNLEPHSKVYFDFARIEQLLQEIRDDEDHWLQYFERCKVSPLVLSYEEIVSHPLENVKRVINYLDIPVQTSIQVGESKLRKQADMTTEAWIQQYYAIKMKRMLDS
ncbi:Stf0 family sulfotransferase [Tengunoibacter tsumagoiensis]|uniref:Sulphotransferase Stf0 domain-containing protein n=1 Tax=Tengunoibacter tsumagoiensis TaxID=2014871 RepID=A0A402A736_9CHLR|nr:Stf0 family sulfotransferase [Tengunoibacter tsumagoiensis]GCE14952.1 hypothetical protein KTT_48110 [Tengunoibacter tsumagoiensis]